MTNQIQSSNVKNYDLGERTAKFGEDVIEFLQSIKINVINKELISQLVRSSTSIGANYEEADGAVSKRILEIKLELVKKNRKKQSFG